MRKITAWIFGLLTAALLVFAAHRYCQVRLQLRSAMERLENLELAQMQLSEENRELEQRIGQANAADYSEVIASGLDPVGMTDRLFMADNADQ